MSSSVSLTLSENQYSKEPIELAPGHFDATHNQMSKAKQFATTERPNHARIHRASHPDVRSLRTPSSPDGAKLRRWDEQQICGQAEAASGSDGFYLEVDDKMSRNSYEYPQQQAKYIERWLINTSDQTAAPNRSKSFVGDDSVQFSGNVVGIRGFSSESFFDDGLKIRAELEQLRRDHVKLQADYIELRSKLASSGSATRNRTSKSGADLEILKSIVLQQSKQLENIASHQQGAMSNVCDRCRGANSIGGWRGEFESMRFAKNQLALKLAHQEQQHSALTETLQTDLNQLRSLLISRDAELVKLKNEIKSLSLEPSNRKLLALSSENTRLRETNDVDKHEHLVLKEDYLRLERKLKALVSDQENLNNEQQEGLKEVLLELCRLQVYQPKLEMILETETQIRMNLQAQVGSLQEEKTNLIDQVDSLRSQMNESKIRHISRESRDVERVREELANWRDKYDRLKQEHSDLNELQRASRAKYEQQNNRLRDENQLARESCQQELERAKCEQRQLKTQVTTLELHLNTMSNQLEGYKSERDRLHQDLLQAHRKASETASGDRTLGGQQEHIRSIANKLRQSEQTISRLQRELSISGGKNKDLTGELEEARNKLEHMKQQYNELKRRFDVQQKLFDEFKDKRDGEVSKLRLDLNLEQYNRQVSLKGIEKELRSSLRELEAMKLRFSKRLNPATGNGSSCVSGRVNELKASEQTSSSQACPR